MPSYDPQQTKLTWGFLIQGAMDGEFYTAEHKEDDVELHVGSTGFAAYVENANKSGTVKFTLSQRSPSNALLSAAFNAKVVALVQMEDLSDGPTPGTAGTLVIGANARIAKHAPIKRGNKIVGMEWTLLVPNLVINAGGDL